LHSVDYAQTTDPNWSALKLHSLPAVQPLPRPKDILPTSTEDTLVRDFCRYLLDAIRLERMKALMEFYSISFGLRDDRKQWEKYGREGRGVAFGVSPDFFLPAPFEDQDHPKPEEEIFCGKVWYGPANATRRHSFVFEAAFGLLKQVRGAGTLRTREEAMTLFRHLAARMYPEVLWNCVTLKDNHWSNQNEVRLLARNFMNKPRLAIVNVETKRWVEIPQPQLRKSLIEVMIGAKADSLAPARMRKLLLSCGVPSVPVTAADS
jgi:Protein of unknown function (DUF2971)